MAESQCHIVHGIGPDTVGLVGRITAPIAGARGNIIDLRQDVLHGLFTIYLVVDWSGSNLSLETLQAMVSEIGEETGLRLTVEPYTPVPRSADKQNLLMILIGKDKPGIIATSSEMLGKYNANIELAKTIGREGVFLMELLTDISHASIPTDNLKRTLSKNMKALNIKTVFQDEHVFNKRKRVILFNISSSFMDAATRNEIMEQTEIAPHELCEVVSSEAGIESLKNVADFLEGVPLTVIDEALKSVTPTTGSLELIQTLKTMGYKIGLVSTGLSFFTDHLQGLLDIDYTFGIRQAVDHDARTMVGELAADEPDSHDIDSVISQVTAREQIDQEDITMITDEGCPQTPGIRLDFQLNVLLDLFNQRAVSKRNLIGLLGGFGIPNRD